MFLASESVVSDFIFELVEMLLVFVCLVKKFYEK